MISTLTYNLLSWIGQVVILASAGAILPLLLRVRYPKAQLVYCHMLIVACIVLPVIEPWVHPVIETQLPEASSQGQAPRVPITVRIVNRILQPQTTDSRIESPTTPLRKPLASHIYYAGRAETIAYMLAVGALLRLSWLLVGLWRIRRCRIDATPLYPIPESIQAATSITHTDAVFCLSSKISGPVMVGWLAPVVLLPESFLKLDDEAQCAVACHELLHVQRADWMVTLLEELAGAIFWFNPGVWMLLAQTRLAREELVDGETVRLTSAREPYMDALLAIARGHQTLDLAPAPLFLRRRHLTQRMHALLNDVSISMRRLVLSYGSISAMVALAGWSACVFFPLVGEPNLKAAFELEQQTREVIPAPTPSPNSPTKPTLVSVRPMPSIPLLNPTPNSNSNTYREVAVPFDAHEPVTGSIQDASDPSARAAALYLIERARANGLTHRQGTPSYQLDVNFTSTSGSGRVTETWLYGQRWRWTGTLGSYSVFRVPGPPSYGDPLGPVPMNIHMVRNAVFWAIFNVPNLSIRTAQVQWNGRPTTCALLSGVVAPADQTRLWEEEEYCVDNSTGAIQAHSIAPGVYTVYGYSRNQQFHGRIIPDRITIYTNGLQTLDADVSLADIGPKNPAELTATAEDMARGPASTVDGPGRFAVTVITPAVSGAIKPVIVHASVDGLGKVLDEELSATSDPSLSQSALDFVKSMTIPGGSGGQRQMYINVNFTPPQ
jgi:beta-lactamase regulating signal transducer with metallopeptidase domain